MLATMGPSRSLSSRTLRQAGSSAVGDIAIGLSAPVVALAYARAPHKAAGLLAAWNVLGLLDLIDAARRRDRAICQWGRKRYCPPKSECAGYTGWPGHRTGLLQFDQSVGLLTPLIFSLEVVRLKTNGLGVATRTYSHSQTLTACHQRWSLR